MGLLFAAQFMISNNSHGHTKDNISLFDKDGKRHKLQEWVRRQEVAGGHSNIPQHTVGATGDGAVASGGTSQELPLSHGVPKPPEIDGTRRKSDFKLTDLHGLDDDSFIAKFKNSLDDIFIYNIQDIQDTIKTYDMEVLGSLRKVLCEDVSVKFPQYQNRRTVNRQHKHTLLPDIGILGHCITKNTQMKELDKIFHQMTNDKTSQNDDTEDLHVDISDGPTPENTSNQELVDVVKSLVTTVNGMRKQLEESERARKEDIQKLTQDNVELRNILTQITNEQNSEMWRKFRLSDLPQNNGRTVVVGSSIVRDISESQLNNTTVIVKHGGLIKDIKHRVAQLPGDKCLNMCLVAGGNDCSGSPDPITVVESYKELITAAKEKAIYVKVSSICPRSDETVNETIQSVNAGLVSLCADEDVTFVDNTTSFFLADKTINDGYIMYDGVHLTRSGTNKLAKNLGLSMKDSSKGVCVYHKNLKNQSTKNTEQMNNYDHNHNDDDTHADTEQFGHTFWNKAQQKAVRPQAPTRKPQQTTHFRPNMNNNNNNNNRQ